MRALVFLLPLLPAVAVAAPWKPHPIKVTPGVPMRAADIKPYVAPKLPPDPPLDPTDAKSVKVIVDEAVVNIRPWSSPLLGNAARDMHLAVKGTVKGKPGSGCKLWYALEPFGYVCQREVAATDAAPSTESVLKVKEGSRLPFLYVMSLVKEGDKLPMWANLDDLKKGAEPERFIERGDTVAVDKTYKHDGAVYWISVEGKVLAQKGMFVMGGGSEWHGIDLTDGLAQPFGWITVDKANAYAALPDAKALAGKTKPVADAQVPRRARVNILGEELVGKRRWLKVTVAAPPPVSGENLIIAKDAPKRANPDGGAPDAAALPTTELWIVADAVNEVRKLDRPKTIPEGVTKWIDVDLGEQTLVLYENDKPIWATLVSSGRAIPTPMGTYPVWAKAAAITMKNQPYEDKGYFVNKVPWSTFFQWHNAIHGAYWHDKFGVVKSHGCVNVAPLDARHVFEWVTPPLPPGWTGLRPLDLLSSPTVVVRNSHLAKQFRQDRPIGPPDRELESQRLEEAEKRRADEAAAKSGPETAPPPAPAP